MTKKKTLYVGRENNPINWLFKKENPEKRVVLDNIFSNQYELIRFLRTAYETMGYNNFRILKMGTENYDYGDLLKLLHRDVDFLNKDNIKIEPGFEANAK